jgi:hypothetical protein
MKRAFGLIGSIGMPRAAPAIINDDMRDMDFLGP